MNLGIEEEGTNKLWLLNCPRLPLDSPTFKGPGHAVMGFLCWEDRELIISHTLSAHALPRVGLVVCDI